MIDSNVSKIDSLIPERKILSVFYNREVYVRKLKKKLERKDDTHGWLMDFKSFKSIDFDFVEAIKNNSIWILSSDFYKTHEKEIILAFKNQKKEFRKASSIIMIYRPDEIDFFAKKNSFSFDVMIEEQKINFFLTQTFERELDQITQYDADSSQTHERKELSQSLLKIGTELGATKDTSTLLNHILIESMKITHADAGSLAIKGFDQELQRADDNLLTFYTSFNYSKKIEFNRFSLEINQRSLNGYAVLNKKVLNIRDAYQVKKDQIYQFNKSFDQETGFRTQSVLVVPMIDHEDKVFGVLQLINKKKSYKTKIDYERFNSDLVIPFDQRDEINVKAITNFASLAMENAILYKDDLSKSLLKIGVELGMTRDTSVLLNNILIQSMEITQADAGSLAIRGFDKDLERCDQNMLTFYTSFNYSKDVKFSRFSLKIDQKSLAGYSVLKKKILNIDDAYRIGNKKVYQFNKSFDQKTGFRTKSILVVPMINHKNRVFGVLQLINKKKKYTSKINYEDFLPDEINSFSKVDESNVEAIANFASIATENAILYKEIERSFESFVRASVYAVEQRDPATSGHSDRVAGYCISLAEACNQAKGDFEDFNLNQDQMKELRYAALLHDFGKIGIREHVLVKKNKLENHQLKDINRKFSIYLLQKKLEIEQGKVKLVQSKGLSLAEIKGRLKQMEQSFKKEQKKIKDYWKWINQINQPTILAEDSSRILKEVNEVVFELDRVQEKLLSDQEYQYLKIPKGSLSEQEREEIQSHVEHSFLFLEKIPWSGNLEQVAEIAYGHHEKLDGSGYPRGIKHRQIMPQTRIMTVCDIFDALVASDRPYKKSLPIQKAIDILNDEAQGGKIEQGLVDLMVRSKTHLLYQN